jgi:hypothetical protein
LWRANLPASLRQRKCMLKDQRRSGTMIVRHQWTQMDAAIFTESNLIQPFDPANVNQRRNVRPLTALEFQEQIGSAGNDTGLARVFSQQFESFI